MTKIQKSAIQEGEWEWLQPHLRRGGLIVVAQGLDLLQAAQAVANDDSGQVAEWIRAGLLNKPTEAQVQRWKPSQPFEFVVAQPYVLIREMLAN